MDSTPRPRFKIKGAAPGSDPPADRRGGPRPMPRIDVGLGVQLTTNHKRIHTPNALTRHQVAMMAAMGIKQVAIAKILRINVETLALKYEEELELGQDRATIRVASELFKLATTGKGIVKLGAIKHWLNARGKGQFIEVMRNEHSGPEGAPIQSETFALTDEERAVRLLQLLASRGEGGAGRDPSEG